MITLGWGAKIKMRERKRKTSRSFSKTSPFLILNLVLEKLTELKKVFLNTASFLF
jgi:hypothetical protein